MKKLAAVVMAALAALVLGAAGNALATDTAQVTVSATVLATCGFNSGGVLAFGNLDPGTGLDVTVPATTQPVFVCSNGVNYTITDDDGVNESGVNANRMIDGSGNFLPYSISYTATGVASGNPTSMNISGTVLYANYGGAVAGVYGDTVTVTINP